MISLYIILGIGAVIFTWWVIWALNTELALFCWINGKRVFRGYFENLGDLNDYLYKLEAIHGDRLTDWIIKTVRKHRYVKQISGIDAILLKDAIYMEEIAATQQQISERSLYIREQLASMAQSTKEVVRRTKEALNEN